MDNLLKTVGLLEEKEDKKYVVKIMNVNEDYFEIYAANEHDAAKYVSEFVIQNNIVELDFNKKFWVEVEEINEELEEQLEEDPLIKMQCENCDYYCPYCEECFFGE